MYFKPNRHIQGTARLRTLYAVKSPYQRIEYDLTNRGLGLFLDDEMQFTEASERSYHGALAGSVSEINTRMKDVLILGGGDGLAARNIFEYNPNARVMVAELDPYMIHTAQTYNPMVSLNRGALSRTINVIDDAQNTVRKIPDRSVDAVLCDFPDNCVDMMSLYGPYMYSEIFRMLKPGGVVSSYPGGSDREVREIIHNQFRNSRAVRAEIDQGMTCQIIQGVKRCLA